MLYNKLLQKERAVKEGDGQKTECVIEHWKYQHNFERAMYSLPAGIWSWDKNNPQEVFVCLIWEFKSFSLTLTLWIRYANKIESDDNITVLPLQESTKCLQFSFVVISGLHLKKVWNAVYQHLKEYMKESKSFILLTCNKHKRIL